MATIRIRRNDESINSFIAYGIYIDGSKVGDIANEDVFSWKLAPGRHTIYVRLDWLHSHTLTFQIAANETRTFEVSSLRNTSLLILALFLAVLYNTLRFLFGVQHPYLILLIFPAIFVLLYFLTIGRKKYLSLSEDTGTPPPPEAVPGSGTEVQPLR